MAVVATAEKVTAAMYFVSGSGDEQTTTRASFPALSSERYDYDGDLIISVAKMVAPLYDGSLSKVRDVRTYSLDDDE